MVSILVKPSLLHLAQFLADLKPNDNVSEFIDGRIYQKLIPQAPAIYLQTQLWDAINTATPIHQQAIAYPSHRCSFGDWSIITDLAIFLDPTFTMVAPHSPLPWSSAHSTATSIYTSCPDWTIEILLPEQDSIHVIRSVLHCLAHGTQMTWLIDLNNRIILVFFPDRVPCEIRGHQGLPSPNDLNLHLTANEVLSWIPAKE